MPVDADALVVRRRVGRLLPREVGNIEPGPTPGARVPPDVFLSLGPRLAGRVRGGAVVEDAPVAGPRKSPLRIDIVVRSAVPPARHVLPRRRKDPRVNPDATGRGAIILQALVIRELAVIGDGKAVDLHQDLLSRWLVCDP